MKILKLKEDFKKMPDKNWMDIQKINRMIDSGWKFATHKEYKGVSGTKEIQKVETTVSESKEKKTKEKSKKKK